MNPALLKAANSPRRLISTAGWRDCRISHRGIKLHVTWYIGPCSKWIELAGHLLDETANR
jgi:hypothetical protein